MSSTGAAPRAAVPVSSVRAEASRRNGAKSRGPKTPEGKARAAQNALKHGLRAQKHVVLPEEDADEFAGLEAALVEELAPVGVLQMVLARRVAVAAWRLARADRIEVELFEERRFADGGLGLALIRDGNGTRSFETLLRYRGAAMAEFWRALRTLKALQAEQAVAADRTLAAHSLEVHPEPPAPGGTLHEPAAPWLPNEPDAGRRPHEPERGPTPCAAAASCQTNPNMAGPRTRASGTATPAHHHTDPVGNAHQEIPGSRPTVIDGCPRVIGPPRGLCD